MERLVFLRHILVVCLFACSSCLQAFFGKSLQDGSKYLTDHRARKHHTKADRRHPTVSYQQEFAIAEF